MNPEIFKNLQAKFKQLFTGDPLMVRSPGRINLIGEHTDYNEGYVLPAAIDREIDFCLGLNEGKICNLFSWDLQQQFSFELTKITPSKFGWANYIIGVVQQLQKRGSAVLGFNCVFGGDIPIGAGLSSSAALECGVAFGLSELMDLGLSGLEIAKLSQAAENEFVGMQCGLMDQYASVFGRQNHVLMLDCRSEVHQYFKIDLKNCGLWLFNSNVKHELSDSEYNTRRQECEAGVRMVQQSYPEVKSLRDCTASMLKSIDDPIVYQRCAYVLAENQRVVQASHHLQKGELTAFGGKMYLSHQGLSQQYQVSCPELDLLVDLTREENPILGARMMGGGFGGCTINLIQKDAAEWLIDKISGKYYQATGKDIDVYPVNIADGTSLASIEINSQF